MFSFDSYYSIAEMQFKHIIIRLVFKLLEMQFKPIQTNPDIHAWNPSKLSEQSKDVAIDGRPSNGELCRKFMQSSGKTG